MELKLKNKNSFYQRVNNFRITLLVGAKIDTAFIQKLTGSYIYFFLKINTFFNELKFNNWVNWY